MAVTVCARTYLSCHPFESSGATSLFLIVGLFCINTQSDHADWCDELTDLIKAVLFALGHLVRFIAFYAIGWSTKKIIHAVVFLLGVLRAVPAFGLRATP